MCLFIWKLENEFVYLYETFHLMNNLFVEWQKKKFHYKMTFSSKLLWSGCWDNCNEEVNNQIMSSTVPLLDFVFVWTHDVCAMYSMETMKSSTRNKRGEKIKRQQSIARNNTLNSIRNEHLIFWWCSSFISFYKIVKSPLHFSNWMMAYG